MLVIAPLAEWSDNIGGIVVILSMVVALPALCVFQMLRTRTALRAAVIVDGNAPRGHLRHELRRVLPRIYAAYLLGTIIGIAIAFQAPPALRWSIFVAAAIVVSFVLRLL